MERDRLGAVVSVGDELVAGQTVDTNSAWLSERLAGLGVQVVQHLAVGDDAKATAAAISRSAELAGWVIVTGGLGPTPDDLTRQAAADLLGEPLSLRAEALAQIEARFARMGRKMAEVNRVQAMAPRSAGLIVNEWGTAPGLRFRVGDSDCFCLPGVPGEMQAMFAAGVGPVIRSRLAGGPALLFRTVHTFGIGESDLAVRLGELLARGRNPQVGTTAAGGSVSVRIYARGDSPDRARVMLDEAARQVQERLGEFCFGQDDQTLESVVGDLLRSAGQTVAVAESCTGGLLGELITSVPGSSDYFVESVVSYANASKLSRLKVRQEDLAEFGAVSEPVARQMAEGARRTSGADWGLSVTGIAGPGGGSEDKPAGLVFIGVAFPSRERERAGTEVHRHLFLGDRQAVRLRAARTALNRLRLRLAPGKLNMSGHGVG